MRIALVTALLVALASPAPDGRHDFDFEIGTWTISPGGYRHIVRKLWDGATIAQLIVPDGSVRGSLLSLYDPNRRVWNVYWADAKDGSLSSPMSGTFRDGVGTFTGADTRDGRAITGRVVYDRITTQSFRTVESESTDGGQSWKIDITRTYSRN